MNKEYRLMTYFAVATLYFFRDEIVPIVPGETLGMFAERNANVIRQVVDQGRDLFDYDLSHEQIGRAVRAYCCPAEDVSL
jgi:hypothetical protein